MANNYTYLTKELAIADFRLRYSNSVLGYLWSLLNPLMTFGVLYVIFSLLMRFDVPHYQLYLLLGIVIWNFFSEGTTNAMMALLNKGSLIKKVYFPRIILIIASNMNNTLTFVLNLFVFYIFFIFSDAPFYFTTAFALISIMQLMMMIFGVSLILSAFYIRFRDLAHLWQVALQIGFWTTPIIYPISLIPERFMTLYMLNPMARIIQDMRGLMIYGNIPGIGDVLLTTFMCMVFLGLGLWIFKVRSHKFAEEL